MTVLLFDETIPAATGVLRTHFGERPVETTLLRDAIGLLSVVLPDNALAGPGDWDALAARLHKSLGTYSPGERQVLLRTSDLIDPSDVIDSPDRIRLADVPNTWLVDRLQTNQDWLRKPLLEEPPIPTAVAFSIKGGVGRTTAFALWAWHLIRQGKDVVLVDLDLEAPGIAGMLLDEAHLPDYGLVDWLVEEAIGQTDDRLLRDSLADCELAADEPGRLRVLPAFGRKSKEYINKLGRVYMPTFSSDDGGYRGLAERLGTLLERIARLSGRPDVVLLDARARLHDIGSAAVTRLGAEVFLFARDDAQTWQGYRQLFRHLANARSVAVGMADDDLRWRLKMVGAQVDAMELARLRFVDRSYSLWIDELYDAEVDPEEEQTRRDLDLPVPENVFDREHDSAPHFPLFVQFDPRVRGFNLTDRQARPDWSVVETAFGDFFAGATARLFPELLLAEED